MIGFSFKTNKNYAIDIYSLHKYREFEDGIDFIDFKFGLDLFEGDHNPKFTFFVGLLNVSIIDFTWYNIHHIDEEEPSE